MFSLKDNLSEEDFPAISISFEVGRGFRVQDFGSTDQRVWFLRTRTVDLVSLICYISLSFRFVFFGGEDRASS